MRELGPDTLRQLTEAEGFPRATIHSPMVRGGQETRKNRIYLVNAAQEVARQLTARGLKQRDADQFVRPIVDYANNEDRMNHQNEGLSLFVDSDTMETFQLPFPLKTQVEVGERFSVAQLIEPAVNNTEFAALTLSLGGVGLYRCSRFTAEQIELQELPEDLCYVLRFDDFEKSLQLHTDTVRGDAMFHGHGAGKDEHDAFVKRFVDETEPVVTGWLNDARLPLVLIGMDDVVGMYAKENHYYDLVEDHRMVDPHTLSLDDVIRIGWECIAPRMKERQVKAIERYRAADHRALDPHGVLEALIEGRVATLFVNPAQEIRGTFDADRGEVHVEPDPERMMSNISDLVVAYALRTKVEVVVVDGEMEAPAAILYGQS